MMKYIFVRSEKVTVSISLILSILLIGSTTAWCSDPEGHFLDERLIRQAQSNIELFRKGDAIIKLVSSDSSILEESCVEVRQTSHDFLFGNVIRYRHFNNPKFKRRFKELFNFATLLEFNWAQYEPLEGETRRRERIEIAQWCKKNQITTNGHMLVWTRASGMPRWIFSYDKKKRYELLKARVKNVVKDYTGMIDSWVVVNEPINCRSWNDYDAPEGKKEQVEKILPYVRDSFDWSYQSNPQAILILNEYNMIVSKETRQRFIELVKRLQERKTPIKALGVQAHEPSRGQYWYSAAQLWETYNQLAALGYPLYITEFIPQSSGEPITGGWREGTWNEETQAEYAEWFYQISFSHPAVACIVWFGLADDDTWQQGGGVLDDQYRPKKVYETLKRMIHEKWNTRISGKLKADGTYSFRGFYGRYDIRVYTPQGNRLTFRIHLKENRPNRWALSIENDAKGHDQNPVGKSARTEGWELCKNERS